MPRPLPRLVSARSGLRVPLAAAQRQHCTRSPFRPSPFRAGSRPSYRQQRYQHKTYFPPEENTLPSIWSRLLSIPRNHILWTFIVVTGVILYGPRPWVNEDSPQAQAQAAYDEARAVNDATYPPKVADELRKALYFQLITPDIGNAIYHFRRAIQYADQAGMDPFSGVVIHIKTQCANAMQDAGMGVQAYGLLAIVQKDLLAHERTFKERYQQELRDKLAQVRQMDAEYEDEQSEAPPVPKSLPPEVDPLILTSSGRRNDTLTQMAEIDLKIVRVQTRMALLCMGYDVGEDRLTKARRLIDNSMTRALWETHRRNKDPMHTHVAGPWMENAELGALLHIGADFYSNVGKPDLAVPLYRRTLAYVPPDSTLEMLVLQSLGMAILKSDGGIRGLKSYIDRREASGRTGIIIGGELDGEKMTFDYSDSDRPTVWADTLWLPHFVANDIGWAAHRVGPDGMTIFEPGRQIVDKMMLSNLDMSPENIAEAIEGAAAVLGDYPDEDPRMGVKLDMIVPVDSDIDSVRMMKQNRFTDQAASALPWLIRASRSAHAFLSGFDSDGVGQEGTEVTDSEGYTPSMDQIPPPLSEAALHMDTYQFQKCVKRFNERMKREREPRGQLMDSISRSSSRGGGSPQDGDVDAYFAALERTWAGDPAGKGVELQQSEMPQGLRRDPAGGTKSSWLLNFALMLEFQVGFLYGVLGVYDYAYVANSNILKIAEQFEVQPLPIPKEGILLPRVEHFGKRVLPTSFPNGDMEAYKENSLRLTKSMNGPWRYLVDELKTLDQETLEEKEAGGALTIFDLDRSGLISGTGQWVYYRADEPKTEREGGESRFIPEIGHIITLAKKECARLKETGQIRKDVLESSEGESDDMGALEGQHGFYKI